MVKLAVCDDEREMADHISVRLREYFPGECEIKKYGDGESLLADRRRESFDAVFLDIGMPKMNGFELARKIREDDPYVQIIFVTNREDLAYIGYKFAAFRFVRKSDLEPDLRDAAENLKKYFDSFSEYMDFKTPTGEITRAVKSIIYFEVKGHIITMVSDEFKDQVYGTMRDYCAKLKIRDFIQVHKSYLVNLKAVSSVEKEKVKLSCGKVLPMSRKRADTVKKAHHDFLHKQGLTAS